MSDFVGSCRSQGGRRFWSQRPAMHCTVSFYMRAVLTDLQAPDLHKLPVLMSCRDRVAPFQFEPLKPVPLDCPHEERRFRGDHLNAGNPYCGAIAHPAVQSVYWPCFGPFDARQRTGRLRCRSAEPGAIKTARMIFKTVRRSSFTAHIKHRVI